MSSTQPSSTPAAISVDSITKSFGEHKVLRGVNLSVAPGSIHALLGANGAGKTTLIKILTTLMKPTSGTASVAGFDVATHAEDVRAAVSLTGQFSAVDSILTGQENLELIARLRHLPQPKKIAHDLLQRGRRPPRRRLLRRNDAAP
jgi:ABC-2 type transport system ATP-binding protein